MGNSSRRDFLKTSLITSGGFFLSSLASGAVGPNDKVNVACIGVRGQGGNLLHNFASQKDVSVTHIADIDQSVRERRGEEIKNKTGKKPTLVNDYRDLLKDTSIDVFVIGTPDHWHALPTIHGCQANKDVYVEKPDGHNVLEGREMVKAARKHKRIVQMGTQARSAPYLQEAAKYVQSGAIGKVLMGKAWETSRQGAVTALKDGPVPQGVDYDLWLGPAPKREFNRRRFHGSWRWFFDYGCGDLGNDGVHRLDYCRWILGAKGLPRSVSGAGGKFFFKDAQEWPDTMMITYEYPGQILTYEMRIWSRPKLHGHAEGAAVYGDNGWILLHNTGWSAYDANGKVVKEGTGRSNLQLHIRNFLDAVHTRKRESLNQEIGQGHESSVMCHAGNVAWRTGKKLHIDPETESFDDREANQYLGREYRKGFELPKV